MVRLILFLCSLPLVGCGFLDDDLWLDDEAFASSDTSSYTVRSCGTRSVYRRSTMHTGELVLFGERSADYELDDTDEDDFEVDFEGDDVRSTARATPLVVAVTPQAEVDPWLSEFVRMEDEQLEHVQATMVPRSFVKTSK